MTKREKIILGLVGVAVLYGAFEVFAPAVRRATPVAVADGAPDAQIAAFLAQTRAAIAKAELSASERRILERAQQRWPETPLAPDAVASAVSQSAASPSPFRHRYSGFIDTAGRRLAIVDGREYRVGEELVKGQIVVEAIEADKVVLRRKRDGTAITVVVDGLEPK